MDVVNKMFQTFCRTWGSNQVIAIRINKKGPTKTLNSKKSLNFKLVIIEKLLINERDVRRHVHVPAPSGARGGANRSIRLVELGVRTKTSLSAIYETTRTRRVSHYMADSEGFTLAHPCAIPFGRLQR
jgi:hypothetical protein